MIAGAWRRVTSAIERAALVAVFALIVHPAVSKAADDGVVTPSISGGLRYDSNSFRLPSDANSQGQAGSAVTRTLTVGLSVDKTYGLQTFHFDGDVTRYKYSNYSSLDLTGHNVNASYAWKLTPSVGGDVIYRSTEAPSDFANVGFETVANAYKTVLTQLDANWQPGAAVHPQIAFTEVVGKSQRASFQQENSTTRSVTGSLIYTFPSQNTVELFVRGAHGEYDNLNDATLQTDAIITQPFATNFHEFEPGLRTSWRVTGLWSANAEVGYLDRTHPGFQFRNFAGYVASANLTFQATGKTSFVGTVSRQLYSSQSDLSSYVVQNFASITGNWAVTQKVTVRPSYTVNFQTFRKPPIPVDGQFREQTRAASLDLVWSPIRALTLTGSISHERRDATEDGFKYSNTGAQVAGRFQF